MIKKIIANMTSLNYSMEIKLQLKNIIINTIQWAT